ncbi:MAG TPA: replication factor C small subunit [Nanoarchaeota archaeon]|nr:replication factor C small subunit [Nanoarchaeota archaeon]
METLIWTEKYRPRDFNEIKGQGDIIKTIHAMVEKQNLPHLLFSGPAGVGKTTLSLIIARKLFGESWKQNFLELNASVAPETPILIKERGRVKRTNFGKLAEACFKDSNPKYAYPESLEILSINKEHKIKFMPVKNISRHKVGRIAKISYEGGYIRTSLNHSVIVLDKEGNLSSKEVACLKTGDHLITFKDAVDSGMMRIPVDEFAPKTHNQLRSGLIENPRVKTIIDYMEVDNSNSWLMGLYLAEGCTSFKGKTSGQTIFTVRYPHEEQIAQKVAGFAKEKWGIPSYIVKGKSGFNRNIESSIQVRLLNTQLARFFKNNFYDAMGIKRAPFKRVPCFMFDAPLESKWAFLQGYMGDACGDWESYLRYSSASQENLIDIAWLGRLSGLDTSVFNEEARIVWKRPSFSYLKTELLPAELLIELANKLGERKGFNAKYLLRHHLYCKKAKRISKDAFHKILTLIESKSSLDAGERDMLKKFGKLIESPLSIIQIKKISIDETYHDFVYDVSVPGAEMFWGGTTPVLLHNSDDRGIDVVRNTIKDFAKTRAIGNFPFKIIYLDECDSLTKEAQQALRRTMENFVSGTRFILSCNYSSKIIDAIQSRCAVFKFRPLEANELLPVINDIAKKESLDIDEAAKKALCEMADGDVRKVVNILQSCAALTSKVTEKSVYSIASLAEPKEIADVLNAAVKGDFSNARSMLLDTQLKYGLSGIDIIKQIQKEVWKLNIPDKEKLGMIEKCGEIEFRMVEGADEFVQLEALIASFIRR